jgi:hypothetical protein
MGQGCGYVRMTCGSSERDMAWYVCCYRDVRMLIRGDVPGLGLTDGNIGLLRGVDCDILTQGLIGLIEYSYYQGISSFPEAQLKRTLSLSVLGLEQF